MEPSGVRLEPYPSKSTGPRQLLLIGANHLTCPLSVREALLRRVTYGRMRKAGGRRPPWEDLILLTTCNRIEAYAITRNLRTASRALRTVFGLSRQGRSLYVLEDDDAAEHLLRVASGLDSLAQGESQITGQVRRAGAERPASWGSDTLLVSLFTRAAYAASRIRELAALNGGSASASNAAIRFIKQTVPIAKPEVVLLGTGKMARIAAKALRSRAAITVLNRDRKRARDVGASLGGNSGGFSRLQWALVHADVVLAATASRKPLVTVKRLRAAVARRSGRPLWLIDLGFPRNIDPRCRPIERVTLTDLDGLAPWGSQPVPPVALARAESRIREEAIRLLELLRPEEIDVTGFRKAVEEVRRMEVDRALARMPRLSDEDRAVVDKLATRLVNRFLHGPTERLRRLPEEARTRIVNELVRSVRQPGGHPR